MISPSSVLVTERSRVASNEWAGGVGVAEGFSLECVDPGVEPRFVRTATQVSEILKQHERVVVVRVDNALVRSEPIQNYAATVYAIIKQTDQQTALRGEIDTRTLYHRREQRIDKLGGLHRRGKSPLELSAIDERTRERETHCFQLTLLIKYQSAIGFQLRITWLASESSRVKPVEKHARRRQFIFNEQVCRDIDSACTQTIAAQIAAGKLRRQFVERG